MQSIADTTDADELLELAQAAQLLAENLTSEQAQAALDSTLEALAASTDPAKLRTLAQVAQSLPVRLTAEQADATLTQILEQLGGTTAVSRMPVFMRPIEPLATAVQALASKLTAEQAGDALAAVLAAVTVSGEHSPDQLRALAEAVQALPVALTTAQVRQTMAEVLKAIATPTTNEPAEAWIPIGQALAAKLSAEQASDALGPVFDAIKGTAQQRINGDWSQAEVLAAMAQALAVKLTPEQSLVALGRVLESVDDETDYDQFFVLTAARGLARTLRVEQLRAAAAPALTALARRTDLARLQTLAQALAVPLTAEQVRDALAGIGAPAQAGQALLLPSKAGPAQDALGSVLAALKGRENFWLLAQAIHVLAVQLSDEQARDALDPAIKGLRSTTSHYEVHEIAQTIPVVATLLTNEQANATLGNLIRTIRLLAWPGEAEAWTDAVRALAGKLTAEQARDGMSRLLGEIGDTATDLDLLPALWQAVQALAGQLTGEPAEATLTTVLPGLAWAPTSDEATRWAGVLVTLLPREPPEGYVRQIVEVLKYPTSAEAATDVLLNALHGIDPKAPGKEAGLVANLAWLKAVYPAIDLDAPPVCPDPLPDQQDLACPDGGA